MTLRRQILRGVLFALAILAGWSLLTGIFILDDPSGGCPTCDRLKVITSRVNGILLFSLCTGPLLFAAERLPLAKPRRWRNAMLMGVIVLVIAAAQASANLIVPIFGLGLNLSPRRMTLIALAMLHPNLIYTSAIVAGANLWAFHRRTVQRRQAEARFRVAVSEARLRRLRSDLCPHFLFNALNAVLALVNTRPAAAERMVDDLAELLRQSLRAEDAVEVRLSEELEFTARYLDIQKMRFGGRLRARVRCESDDLTRCEVPPLLIQPLVENAIVHSVSRRHEGGVVEVDVRADESWLVVTVSDDGPGSTEEEIFAAGRFGVRAAKTRLEYLYGDRHTLRFYREGGWFVAEVRMPRVVREERLAS